MRRSVQEKWIYKHQADAVKCLRDELFDRPEGHVHGNLRNVSLAVLPTGTGKTGVGVLAAYACGAAKVLIVTPSETISKQQLTQFTVINDPQINPLQNEPFFLARGIFTPEDKIEDWAPVNSVCALNKRDLRRAIDGRCELVIANAHKFGDGERGIDMNEFDQDYFSLVIVDEAHHYPAVTWRRIVEHFQQSKIIFLTATPQNQGHYILKNKKPCYTFDRDVAIAEGIIRKIEFHDFESREFANDDVQVEPETPETWERNAEILTVLLQVKQHLLNHNALDRNHAHKAMILASSQREARTIARIWNESQLVAHGACRTFVEGDPNNVVDHFRDPKIIYPESETNVLVIIRRLTEGFDYKNVSVVAILRNVRSKVYFTQFIGRAVRKLHRDDPVVAMVLSHEVHKQREIFDRFDCQASEDPDDNED